MKFIVTGHAFVPNKFRVEIEAKDAEQAMRKANKKLKTGLRNHIIPGSEDEGAAWGFNALDAEAV